MIERFIIRTSIILSVLFIPTLFKRPSVKLWVPFFIFNGAINVLIDSYLVSNNYLKYPKRFVHNKFKINIVYDILICPFLTVWYCQSSFNSTLREVVIKLLLFSTPQAIYEILLERKTKLLKFNKRKWTWVHSLVAVFTIKIFSRAIFEIPKRIVVKEELH